jgi:acyl-coenzyme A synthetase/AMP-(fatty) acid ligase/thioesterase domain-containing protein
MSTDRQPLGDPPGGSAPVLSLSAVDNGILGRFRQVVAAQPDAIAVVDARRTVTYRQLAAQAALIRNLVLTAHGGNVSTPRNAAPTAVLMNHHSRAIAAVLGVLASGHPVLVLDERTPLPRLRSMVEQVGITWTISEADLGSGLPGDLISLDPSDFGTGEDVETLWESLPDPSEIATLSFTSGSTGQPKVVAVDHRQLVHDAWANSVGGNCYGAGDVLAHTLPIAFNAGLNLSIAGPLVGATMIMYDVRGQGLSRFPRWLADNQVTVLHATPHVLRALIRSNPDPELLSGLRAITVAGEIIHGADVEHARALLGHCVIFNRYGCSEATLVCEFPVAPCDPIPAGILPAGKPVGRTVVEVVGEDGRALAPGQAGTVVIIREYLAKGYWRDEPQTRTSFVDLPDGRRKFLTSDVGRLDEDGILTLIGRRDHSVKIRGLLVEPGEVDEAMMALPGVREAVVVGAPHPTEGRMRLVAYVVMPHESMKPAAVRSALRRTLPAHMVPEIVMFLRALPRTDRGKIDRAQLPSPPAVLPSSEGQHPIGWEQMVGDVWKKALGLEDIGLDDDFFELGGDSLSAETVVSLMHEDIGLSSQEVTTTLLVEAPTVRLFAQRLTRTPEGHSDVLIPLNTGGSRPPLFVMAGGGGLGVAFVQLSRRLGPDQPMWALQAHAMERRGRPDWSVAATARRYLREVRRVQPAGPYHLAGHSFGGLVALEMAKILRDRGESVPTLIFLDSFPPDALFRADTVERSLPAKLGAMSRLLLLGWRRGDIHRYQGFNRLSRLMHARYRTSPYSGDAVVVLAESPQLQQSAGWGRHLTGSWSMHKVSGDHVSMMREPYVADTADVVRWALDGRLVAGPASPDSTTDAGGSPAPDGILHTKSAQ